ncbi:MAG: hypothetical protein Homavirus40_3, partial [Homavirus sp.]
MKLIAHRANTNGPDPSRENNPEYILEAISKGYDVEIDVWKIDYELILAHDIHNDINYIINTDFLKQNSKYLWCHAKNIEALEFLLSINMHTFWHNTDDYTITSRGIVWAYPDKYTKGGVYVMPELNNTILPRNCFGICSDYVENYVSKYTNQHTDQHTSSSYLSCPFTGNTTYIDAVPPDFFLYEPSAPILGLTEMRGPSGYQQAHLVKPLLNKISTYVNFNSINTIFDVGSRDCLQSVEFKMRFPHADIHAFEANPKCVDMCRETLERYKDYCKNDVVLNDVVLNDVAVSNYDGEITFHPVIYGNIGASSILSLSEDNEHHKCWPQDTITVNCTKLDTYCEMNNINNIDILWMDVQGVELQVMQGMEKMLQNTKIIHTEIGITPLYKEQVLINEFMQFMEENNFVPIDITTTREGYEADVIFLNKKYLPYDLSELYYSSVPNNTNNENSTSIILQGTITYINDLIGCYKNCEHIVLSTWVDEYIPNTMSNTITNTITNTTTNIKVIKNKMPDNKGFGNLNLQ